VTDADRLPSETEYLFFNGAVSSCSTTKYPEESRVEIAVPYTCKAPNIYTPARIVSSRKGAGKGGLEYHYRVTYLE
jgi:hypothetical protein